MLNQTSAIFQHFQISSQTLSFDVILILFLAFNSNFDVEFHSNRKIIKKKKLVQLNTEKNTFEQKHLALLTRNKTKITQKLKKKNKTKIKQK